MTDETAAMDDTTLTGPRSLLEPMSALPHSGAALPDVRGWRVRTRAGSDIGEVADALVDPVRCRLRYLVVRPHRAFTNDPNHRVLVPIGAARRDQARDDVSVDAGAGCILGAPAYDPAGMTRAYERALLGCFGWRDPAPGRRLATDEFYRGPLFDERPFVAGRSAAPGVRRVAARHEAARDAGGAAAELR